MCGVSDATVSSEVLTLQFKYVTGNLKTPIILSKYRLFYNYLRRQ